MRLLSRQHLHNLDHLLLASHNTLLPRLHLQIPATCQIASDYEWIDKKITINHAICCRRKIVSLNIKINPMNLYSTPTPPPKKKTKEAIHMIKVCIKDQLKLPWWNFNSNWRTAPKVSKELHLCFDKIWIQLFRCFWCSSIRIGEPLH